MGNMERKGCDLRSEEQKTRVQKTRVKKYNCSRRKGMKSCGLFASGADNSGDGSKQKSSELVAQSRIKRKRDESFSRWPDIHDQPADSIYVEPDFNQTVTSFLKSALESFYLLEQKSSLGYTAKRIAGHARSYILVIGEMDQLKL
ncbi:uncharacterized protein LOC124342334 isoform X2 [Daphnia pulicaria]|uniref:uncharacterized protein LOC124337479 isoform X2 n=1 Tax=Daphnia pulicaria TaxID=35523 RepID=UPI001EEA8DBE|nr:uncharacterized protein LOC124337479 isoform X2 [Daphnia pulicaria]XP_046651258.1 uncharacterized protein LOC124342334 isoform X2 [Daphnia pulicaria]